jgi:hypothetical protein
MREWKPVSERQWAKVKSTKEKPSPTGKTMDTDSVSREVSNKKYYLELLCVIYLIKHKPE